MAGATGEIRFVRAGGVRFAYLEEGKGPLVLLLHGFPDTAHTWDVVRPALAGAGFRVVAPFLRGYAPTEVPADARYDAATLGADVLALIEALGAQRAIVVGHDWGAVAAYAAAALQRDRIERLVTVAVPHPGAIPRTPLMLWRARHFLALRRKNAAAMVRADEFKYVDTLLRRWAPTWEMPAGETARVKAAFAEPGCLEAALGYYRAARGLAEVFRKRITVPTLTFCGEHDVVKPKVFRRAESWFTAGYQVVSLPAGHFVHRELPDAFLDELVTALRTPFSQLPR